MTNGHSSSEPEAVEPATAAPDDPQITERATRNSIRERAVELVTVGEIYREASEKLATARKSALIGVIELLADNEARSKEFRLELERLVGLLP